MFYIKFFKNIIFLHIFKLYFLILKNFAYNIINKKKLIIFN